MHTQYTSTCWNTGDGGHAMGEELRHVQTGSWSKHTGEVGKQQ